MSTRIPQHRGAVWPWNPQQPGLAQATTAHRTSVPAKVV